MPPIFTPTPECPGYGSLPHPDDVHHAPFFFWKTSNEWQILGDPERQDIPACPPFTCYLALVGWISYIFDGTSDLEEHYGSVLRTLASRWWALPRTQTQRQAILDAGCLCDDETRKGYCHQSGLTVFHDDPRKRHTVGQYFMTRCYQLITLGGHTTRVRFDRWPSSSQWPYHLKQVLPYGADATCHEIIGWTVMEIPYGCAEDLSFCLSPWINGTGCITVNYLASSGSFARALVQMVNLCIEEWEDSVIKHPTHFEGWYNAKLAHVIAAFQCWTSILDTMVKASEPVAKRFISYAHSKILACLDRLIQCHAAFKRQMPLPCLTPSEAFTLDDDFNDLKHTSGIIGGRIYALYPPSPERLRVSLLAHKVFHEYDRRCLNKCVDTRKAPGVEARLWFRLIKHAELLVQNQTCSHVGCSRTTADMQGSIRACGGCKLFLYCSRRCQICAWNAPGIGHRDLCHGLRSICIQLNLTRKSLQECDSSNFVFVPSEAWIELTRQVLERLLKVAEGESRQIMKDIYL